MTFPREDKTELGLVQPFVIFQIYLTSGLPFSFEIVITDASKVKLIVEKNKIIKSLTNSSSFPYFKKRQNDDCTSPPLTTLLKRHFFI
jgi:hypothetical protein